MDQHAKSELIKSYREQYRRAGKAGKTEIISRVVDVTHYCRKHVIRALNRDLDVPKKIRRKRLSRYAPLYETLRHVWAIANFICGKRLKPFLPELVASLKRHKEIQLSEEDEALQLSVSAATIDRLLAPARKQINLKGRSTTKPGTLLKHQIPIRTFADWNNEKPGFVEIDLVAHCGDSIDKEHINTLSITDIATGWTVCAAFKGRSRSFCVDAIEQVRATLPFQLLGIDSDNDSAFINGHFLDYCERNSLTFTRGRPYRKNDSAHIEQKNWDVVRKMIGYGRFDTQLQLRTLRQVYGLLGLYQNYFQPSRKLLSKKRIGARSRRVYDQAQTPAQRLLARSDTPAATKKLLRSTFRQLNPADLLRNINDLIHELYEQLLR